MRTEPGRRSAAAISTATGSRTDLLFEDSAGDLGLWRISAAQVIASTQFANVGAGQTFKATGDFNGDGISDTTCCSRAPPAPTPCG